MPTPSEGPAAERLHLIKEKYNPAFQLWEEEVDMDKKVRQVKAIAIIFMVVGLIFLGIILYIGTAAYLDIGRNPGRWNDMLVLTLLCFIFIINAAESAKKWLIFDHCRFLQAHADVPVEAYDPGLKVLNERLDLLLSSRNWLSWVIIVPFFVLGAYTIVSGDYRWWEKAELLVPLALLLLTLIEGFRILQFGLNFQRFEENLNA